jgi:hypothetical protein
VILNFEGPVKGTWPLWYDPSYWYAGAGGHFDFKQQTRRLLQSFALAPRFDDSNVTIVDLAKLWSPILVGIAAFALVGMRPRNVYRAMGKHLWLFLWPALALLLFASVLINYRYVFGFAVLGWIALFAAAWVATEPGRALGITVTVTLTVLLSYCPQLAKELAQARNQPAAWSNAAVAGKLKALGIRPGDDVASLDFPWSGAYYSRLAGARIIEMSIGNPVDLSKIPEAEVGQMLAAFRATGAKALFSTARPGFQNDAGWVQLTDFSYVRMLQ